MRDEPDRALPLSESIGVQRKSPLTRNRKTSSMEVNLLILISPIFHAHPSSSLLVDVLLNMFTKHTALVVVC